MNTREEQKQCWFKYPDKKPTKSEWYLVCFYDEEFNVLWWDGELDKFLSTSNNEIVGWLPIPKFPKWL